MPDNWRTLLVSKTKPTASQAKNAALFRPSLIEEPHVLENNCGQTGEPLIPMPAQSNNPKRRIVRKGYFTPAELEGFGSRSRYEGSAHHKLKLADYGFSPPVNPRASKSPCDDIRVILREEASRLLAAGFAKGMVSACDPDDLPKYVWAVDDKGEAYEAKLGRDGKYHGYRLSVDDPDMRKLVLQAWSERSQ